MGKTQDAKRRFGLVVNPSAGRGQAEIAAVIRLLLGKLKDQRVTLIAGTLESTLAAELGMKATVIPAPDTARLDATRTTALLLASNIDVLIGIGGDGTLCDIASVMLERGSTAQLLGIGAGSANVGPLVSLLGSDIERLSFDDLEEGHVHGIDVDVSGVFVGTAFNDVVFGNTFFGTRDGKRTDLDAAAKLAGEDCCTSPKTVCGPSTWIDKNNQRMLTNSDNSIAQIIASPLNEGGDTSGKAISGLMCWGPYLGNHGVLAAASSVMVRTQLGIEDLQTAEPLHLTHISFGANDQITVGGTRASAVVIIDGNPTCLLASSDEVTLRLRVCAVRVLRPLAFPRGLDHNALPRKQCDRKEAK